MAYTQTLIDNFDDASLDLSKWTIVNSPGATESGGKLNQACTAGYPRLIGDQYFNLSSGIIAAKLSTTGTRADGCEFYIGAQDAAGNHVSALGAPNGTYITFGPGGAATFGDEVITDTTVGVGWDWVNGTWWGVGNMTGSTLYMYNSTDGQTWNEMARCTVGGTFDKTAVSHAFMAGVWNGTSPTLVANWDDASFWANESETFVTRKVRISGNWVTAVPKARVDGAWVPAVSMPRVGGTWDPMI